MEPKLCPFKQDREGPFKCDGQRCQWWMTAYTTENIEIEDCAIVQGGIKEEGCGSY